MVLIAVGQICASNSPEKNLQQCLRVLKKAASGGAKIIFLPEASDYIASSATESLDLAKEETDSAFVHGLCIGARNHGIGVSVGIHVPVPKSNPPKLFNRLIYITPEGTLEPAATYDKLHLFNLGALQESNIVESGKSLTAPFSTPAGRVGPLICFDLRFAEAGLMLGQPSGWFMRDSDLVYSKKGANNCVPWDPAHMIVYPSAFTVPTGQAHWEVLLRTRAIETQAYVIAAAQVGQHGPEKKRTSYGHSMVIDPWGKIMVDLPGVVQLRPGEWDAEAGTIEQVGFADIDLNVWRSVRNDWPLQRNVPFS